jgi:hypothetical protein
MPPVPFKEPSVLVFADALSARIAVSVVGVSEISLPDFPELQAGNASILHIRVTTDRRGQLQI